MTFDTYRFAQDTIKFIPGILGFFNINFFNKL